MARNDPLSPRDHGRRSCARMAAGSRLLLKPFHAVILGFCLTVFLAGGAGYALALWSQSATMTMHVSAGTLPSPKLQCSNVTNETAVLVTWTPQRAGATGYDVTVTRNGSTIKTASYPATVTSEKIMPPSIGAGNYTYNVTVTAKYASWQAQPSAWTTIRANVPVLGLLATISCS